ncbi:aspartate aminotransferase family protein [Candidatus Bathyarchaeota archaeon]|nr:aspartate aminotransferase family protein [Candidatus Bathyarchaeota archaeon]
MDKSRTRELFERASRVVPGGIHSNIRYMQPFPYIFERGRGARLFDVDGEEYIDCVVNYGALILGHGDRRVTEAAKQQLESGLTCGVESELSIKLAERLNSIIPCAEMVKFSLSGTEAVAHALNIVRGYTGRDKIIKIEGGYNGWSDTVIVNVHPDPSKAGPASSPNKIYETKGVPENAKENTIVIPFNDGEVAEKAIRDNKDKVAALIVEPVVFNSGAIMPKEGYLQHLREATEKNDVLLIFDEVITGFRLAPGGGQEYFDVTPDLATFAKAMANGFPISAVAGRRDIMKVSAPGGGVMYGGVYNGSQVCVAAALATLDAIEDGEVQRRLNESTQYLSKRFAEIVEDRGVEAQLLGLGGQFCVYFTDEDIVDYRSAAKSDRAKSQRFHRNLLDRGIYTYDGYLFHNGICAAHTMQDLDYILQQMSKSLP